MSDGGSSTDPGATPVAYAPTTRGLLTQSWFFLDMVTLETFASPPDAIETATVTASDDFREINVSTPTCSFDAGFTRINDAGEQVYEIDTDSASCRIVVNGFTVAMVIDGVAAYWSDAGLRFAITGEGTIPNASSIMIVEFDPL